MKKNLLLLLIGAVSVVSCSDDDSSPAIGTSTGDYLPLTAGNYWVYNVEGGLQTGSDSLYVSGQMTAAGNTYTKFQVDELPIGFYSSELDNNGVRKDGDQLLLTGAAEIPFAQQFPISIEVSDFIILSESAEAGEQLSSDTGSLPFEFSGYNFDFNYTLTSTSQGTIASYTAPNGQVYSNVKAVRVNLNLSVTTDIAAGGTSFTATIMPAQNVVVSTRYFAEGIGVVHTVTDIDYSLSNLSSLGIELPIPESLDEHQEEVLVNYQAN